MYKSGEFIVKEAQADVNPQLLAFLQKTVQYCQKWGSTRTHACILRCLSIIK